MATVTISAYQVVLAPNAIIPEQNAAKEVSKYLPLLSEEPLEMTIVEKATEHPAIHVGKSDEALQVFGLNAWSALKPDEVLYKTTDDGDLWIAGEGTRGTLYAVYELLEEEYGVRFLTADDEYLPKQPRIALPPIGTDHRYAPPFIGRATGYDLLSKSGDAFAVKRRNNFFCGISSDWGGTDGIIGFVHTMDRLIPESNFAAHPEWFAMTQSGNRAAGPASQLCLSNKEMRQELIKNTLKWLQEDGGKSHFISVSQNDNNAFCQCENCKAFIAQHGNQTDLLMDCINEVADAVKDEFPNIYVDTLAYTETRQPPKTIRPRDNVAIRYCTIEARSFFPLESQQNQALAQELQAWKQMAKKMLIWNYVTDFTKYYLPHPNWHTMPQDIRLFRECHAINIFQQGAWNHGMKASDLAELRVYLLSSLLWNPDLNDLALVREFCDLHYGPAAQYVYDYLNSTTALALAHPEAKDNCYANNTESWISDQELATLWRRVFQGVITTEEDPVYGPCMAIAALPITMALLERQELLLAKPEKRLPALRDVDTAKLFEYCKRTLAATKATGLSENNSITTETWLDRVDGAFNRKLILPKAPSLGERPQQIPEGTPFWSYNFEDLGGLPSQVGEHSIILKDDPNAVGGKAITMPNTHHEWYLQVRNLPRGVFDVFVAVRCDLKPGKPAQGPAISFGNYPAGPTLDKKVTAAQLAGPEYKVIYMGRSNLSRAIYFYGAPVLNPNVERIWFDRIIVTNPTDDQGIPLTLP